MEVESFSSSAMTELTDGGVGVHRGDDGQTRERQYQYSTVHDSAGHDGQGGGGGRTRGGWEVCRGGRDRPRFTEGTLTV